MVSNLANVLSIFMVLFAIAYCDGPTNFPNEKPCQRAGGFCMPKAECPKNIESQYQGLCLDANKVDATVECCHGISLKETRCRKLGGECQTTCPDFLKAPRAKNCAAGTICCILTT